MDYASLEMIFEEQRRRMHQLEEYKFRQSDSNKAPLCNICSLHHPPLKPNQFVLEQEAHKQA